MSVSIVGSVPVYPTEDEARVKKSVINVLGDCEIKKNDQGLEIRGIDPGTFIENLGRQRIKSTALMVIGKALEKGDPIYLNKQAAFAGRINFTDGKSPLGDICLLIEGVGDELMSDMDPEN